MSNAFHNPSKARPEHAPKNSDRGKGHEPKKDSLSFKAIHKVDTLLGIPKNLGGKIKGKHETLDVL